MSEEGITYNPTGTIDVVFDDETYHLGRPKLKQWRYFTRKIAEMSANTSEGLRQHTRAIREVVEMALAEADESLVQAYHNAVMELEDEDTAQNRQAVDVATADIIANATPTIQEAHNDAVTALEEYTSVPFYETSSKLVAEMFKQLGDKPLPKDMDEWPSWLATDVSLPGTWLTHWRRAPKASGSNGTAP